MNAGLPVATGDRCQETLLHSFDRISEGALSSAIASRGEHQADIAINVISAVVVLMIGLCLYFRGIINHYRFGFTAYI